MSENAATDKVASEKVAFEKIASTMPMDFERMKNCMRSVQRMVLHNEEETTCYGSLRGEDLRLALFRQYNEKNALLRRNHYGSWVIQNTFEFKT